MDNCSTHKSNALREVIEAAGRRLVFLLPYSPDFSPIEESFSCGTILCLLSKLLIHLNHLRIYS